MLENGKLLFKTSCHVTAKAVTFIRLCSKISRLKLHYGNLLCELYWMKMLDAWWFYLLDVRSDIFLDVVLVQSLCGTLHGVLLHVLRHVGIFDHCLPFRHGCSGKHKTQRRIHHLHGRIGKHNRDSRL